MEKRQNEDVGHLGNQRKFFYQRYYKEFGKSLQNMRKQKGLTQEELALRMNPPKDKQYICNLENQKPLRSPSLQTFFEICDALDISPEDLFSGIALDPSQKAKNLSDVIKMIEGGMKIESIPSIRKEYSVEELEVLRNALYHIS